MKISFFRFLYFSETSQSFPSYVENVIVCGSTDQEILHSVKQLMGSNPDGFRRERVGPLSTDTSLCREINWRNLSNLVQNAHQTTDDGACCLFIDCRLIAALDDPISDDPASECRDLPFPYPDVLLETVYLACAYDHFNGLPIAPIYLMKESSFKKAI